MICVPSKRSYWYDKNIFRAGVPLLILLLALFAAPAAMAAKEENDKSQAAEEKPSDEDLSFYGSTSVTATGTAVSTFNLPSGVIVVDADRIDELEPDNAVELLRNEPGMDVNGVGPNQMRPIIRGQRGHRVLLLEDGLRLNNARRQTDFGEISGLVDVANVETVEVVRGSGSVLYGSDAIGGVLNLITKVPPRGKGMKGTVGLRYSDADEQSKIDAAVTGRNNDWSYSLGASTRDASDYSGPAGDFGKIHLSDPVVVHDSGVQDDSFNAYLGYHINDQSSIFFRANVYRADDFGFGYVDPAIFDDPVLNRISYPYQDFDRFTFGYSAAGLENAVANTVNVRAYTQSNDRDNAFFIDINTGPAFGPGSGPDGSVVIDSLTYSGVSTDGIRAEATKTLSDKNLLTYGFEYFEDTVDNKRDSTTTVSLKAFFPISFVCGPSGAVPVPPTFYFECVFEETSTKPSSPNATNSGQGLFVQDSIYASDRFSATVGLRFAKSETKAKSTPQWDTTGLDFSDNDIVGALSMVYGINKNVNLVGSYATAFRAPNIIERLFNGITPEGLGYQLLNPDLESEDSSNIDAGIKYQGPNAFFEAIYFNNKIDNAIIQHTYTQAEIDALPPDVQAEVDQAGVDFVVQQRNADVFKIHGVELSGAYRFDGGVSLGGNYTKLTGEAEVGGPAADPTGSTFSEKLAAFLRYDASNGRWWVEWRLRHNGEEDQNLDPGASVPPVGEVLPSFTVHDLAAGFRVADTGDYSHTLGLIVSNVTDELYAEFSNASFFRPQPERNVALTYRLRKK